MILNSVFSVISRILFDYPIFPFCKIFKIVSKTGKYFARTAYYRIKRKEVFTLISNENLGFYITFSQFIASAINSFHSLLDKLSKDTIISIVLFSHAIFMIIQVFRRKTKGCAPYNLWFIELPPWFIPSVVCICFVALLLLQTSC